MRRKLALVLTASFQFSVCTGGFLSATVAVAGELSHTDIGSPVAMTPASLNVILCQSMTPEVETAAADRQITKDAPKTKGCQQGKACVTQSSAESTDRSALSLAVTNADAVALPPVLEPPIAVPQPPEIRSRSGPPYESSRLLAHVLLKRE